MEFMRKVFLTVLLEDIEIESAFPSTRVVSMWLVVTLGRFVVKSKLTKFIYRNSESVPNFEVRMRLNLYIMRKYGVYA